MPFSLSFCSAMPPFCSIPLPILACCAMKCNERNKQMNRFHLCTWQCYRRATAWLLYEIAVLTAPHVRASMELSEENERRDLKWNNNKKWKPKTERTPSSERTGERTERKKKIYARTQTPNGIVLPRPRDTRHRWSGTGWLTGRQAAEKQKKRQMKNAQ